MYAYVLSEGLWGEGSPFVCLVYMPLYQTQCR